MANNNLASYLEIRCKLTLHLGFLKAHQVI